MGSLTISPAESSTILARELVCQKRAARWDIHSGSEGLWMVQEVHWRCVGCRLLPFSFVASLVDGIIKSSCFFTSPTIILPTQ